MEKNLFLKNFKIKGLFGIYDVDIPFKNNYNIFVGENGLGKTTILNALNYVLQGDGESLSTIDFERIIITLGNNEELVIKHEDLDNSRFSSFTKTYSYSSIHDDDYSNLTKRVILEILKDVKSLKKLNEKETKEKILEKILKKYKYELPSYIIERIYRTMINNQDIEIELKQSWEYKINKYMKNWKDIIYLPTYRRIEEDFNNLIENVPDKDYYRKNKKKNNFSYLQFGMDDVEEAILNACTTLKNNTNEGFKEMTSNLLTNYIKIEENGLKNFEAFKEKKLDSSSLNIVFSRLADKIDTNVTRKITEMIENKNFNDDKYSRFLLTIINELSNIYEKNKQIDENLENFKTVCNNYLVNKKMVYDKFKIECKVIQDKDDTGISLKNLSSGEKQILSLFSKLYLNTNEKSIILFDEPELSLSIIWQKKLIPDIISSGKCGFIMVITHSPFIFDNDYKFHTMDIKEYIKYTE